MALILLKTKIYTVNAIEYCENGDVNLELTNGHTTESYNIQNKQISEYIKEARITVGDEVTVHTNRNPNSEPYWSIEKGKHYPKGDNLNYIIT